MNRQNNNNYKKRRDTTRRGEAYLFVDFLDRARQQHVHQLAQGTTRLQMQKHVIAFLLQHVLDPIEN
jgi:hypothetical protein